MTAGNWFHIFHAQHPLPPLGLDLVCALGSTPALESAAPFISGCRSAPCRAHPLRQPFLMPAPPAYLYTLRVKTVGDSCFLQYVYPYLYFATWFCLRRRNNALNSLKSCSQLFWTFFQFIKISTFRKMCFFLQVNETRLWSVMSFYRSIPRSWTKL